MNIIKMKKESRRSKPILEAHQSMGKRIGGKYRRHHYYNLKLSLQRGISLFIIIVFFAGCSDAEDTKATDILWKKGSVYAEGISSHVKTEAEFNRIYIGGPDYQNTEMPGITLSFPGNKKIFLPDITHKTLINSVDIKRVSSISTWPSSTNAWEENASFYHVLKPKSKGDDVVHYIYSIALINGKIAGCIIYDEGCLGIWNEKLTREYVFPIKQSQLEELFGKPDSVLKATSWEHEIYKEMKKSGENGKKDK